MGESKCGEVVEKLIECLPETVDKKNGALRASGGWEAFYVEDADFKIELLDLELGMDEGLVCFGASLLWIER